MKYVTKPKEVDAILFDGSFKSAEAIRGMLGCDTRNCFIYEDHSPINGKAIMTRLIIRIKSFQGLIDNGEFVIVDEHGAISVVKKATFLKYYEEKKDATN